MAEASSLRLTRRRCSQQDIATLLSDQKVDSSSHQVGNLRGTDRSVHSGRKPKARVKNL